MALLMVMLLSASLGFSQARWHRTVLQRQQSPLHYNGNFAEEEDLPARSNSFRWNDSIGSWQQTHRNSYTYFSNQSIAEDLKEKFNGGVFLPDRRTTFQADGNGNLGAVDHWFWDGMTWQSWQQFTFTYDAHGNVLENAMFIWRNGQWCMVGGERNTYTYLFGDKVGRKQTDYWMRNDGWRPAFLVEYNWPSSGAWDMATYSMWNDSVWMPWERLLDMEWHDFGRGMANFGVYQIDTGKGMENCERLTGSFDQNCNPSYIYEHWVGSGWENYYREVHENDARNHVTSYEAFEWSGSWHIAEGYKVDYTYDWDGRTTEVTERSWDGAVYRPYLRKEYPSLLTGTLGMSGRPMEVAASPNPCSDHLFFSFDMAHDGPVEVALYDLTGRLRMETKAYKQLGQDMVVQVSDVLEAGTFTYRLTTAEGVACGKVVVQH